MPQTGFQRTVNLDLAPGIEGGFASENPRRSIIAGPGTLVAGPNGLIVGRFGCVDPTYTYADNTYRAGQPIGVVNHESNMARITIYLAETSNIVPAGYEVTLFDFGDFWMTAQGTVTVGQKVFFGANGVAITGTAGTTISGATELNWYAWTAATVGQLFKISKDAAFGV